MLARLTARYAGRRTYMTLALMVVTVVLSVIEVGGGIITPEITAGVVTLLGAVAAYFRREATR